MVIDRVSSEFSTNERAENEIKSLGTSKIWANEDRLRSPKGVGDPRFGASLGLPHHARRSNLIDDPLSSQYDRRFRVFAQHNPTLVIEMLQPFARARDVTLCNDT